MLKKIIKLLALISEYKQVSLKRDRQCVSTLHKFESRRRKLQIFLILPQLIIEKIWFPLVTYCLQSYCPAGILMYVAIRTQWECIN